MKIFLSLVMSLLLSGNVIAKVKTEKIKYNHGKRKCVGYLAYDKTTDSKRPGIIIVHQWTGLSDYEKMRAKQLAKMGYVALAVDMYGKGKRAKDHEEAAKLSGAYRKNRELMRARAYADSEPYKTIHSLIKIKLLPLDTVLVARPSLKWQEVELI